MIIWLPLTAIIYLFDRDPTKYITGKWFRKLGGRIVAVNPSWKVEISGRRDIDDRKPYVMISNHLSNADIPVISLLNWEMKWISKMELFKIPVTGWMMSMANDISIDRQAKNRGAQVFKSSVFFLDRNTSIMFFPEGTRSKSGKLGLFRRGAFDIAIRKQLDILPIVIDGTQNCLPKNTWKFGKADKIQLKVLDPISTKGFKKEDVDDFIDSVRSIYLKELSEMRGIPEKEIDALLKESNEA